MPSRTAALGPVPRAPLLLGCIASGQARPPACLPAPNSSAAGCAAQERRADEGTALVFPSQAAVRQKDEVEAELFGKPVMYHCHSQKVVKERR